MNNIKEWLLRKLPVLVPCQFSQIISGTEDFSIKFGTEQNTADPLYLTLQSKKKNNNSADPVFVFSVSGELPELRLIKRLRKTPFYISSLSYHHFTLFIIDFYEWTPVTLIYRIFYFQSISDGITLDISLPTQYKLANHHIFNIGNGYFTTPGSSSDHLVKSELKIPISGDGNGDQSIICVFSEKQLSSDDLTIEMLIAKIDRLENMTRKFHILNYIRIQNKIIQDILDELWCSQKGINPDQRISETHVDENVTNADAFLWSVLLSNYMGWNHLIDSNLINQYQKIIDGMDDSYQILYDAYFNHNYKDDELINALQSWWDQFSLPLYRMKFNRELNKNPSLIFIIYSLSLRMNLPWSQDLYHMSNFFYQNSQLALLAILNQMMIVLTDQNNTIKIIPGPGFSGNVQSLRRGNSIFCYTHFGKKNFTSLSEGNNQLIKIDKEIILQYNLKQNEVTIYPHVLSYELDRLQKNNISIQINNNLYHIPLIWKKAELSLPGCRLRWIFKKDRFQITCQPDKSLPSLKVDGKEVTVNHKKITFYRSAGKSENIIALKLLDISGRSFVLNQNISENFAQIIGWIQERNGLLVDHVNVRINSRYLHYGFQESGIIRLSFTFPLNVTGVEIVTKKIHQIMPIKKIKNKVFNTLMLYSPQKSRSLFLAVLDDKLKACQEEIRCLFLDLLGFIPIILYNSEVKKGIFTNDSIRITQSDVLYHVDYGNGNRKSPVLSLKYPEGVQNLFNILSEKLANINSGDDD